MITLPCASRSSARVTRRKGGKGTNRIPMTADMRHLEQPDPATLNAPLPQALLHIPPLLTLVPLPLLNSRSLRKVLPTLIDVQTVFVEVGVELGDEEGSGDGASFVAFPVRAEEDDGLVGEGPVRLALISLAQARGERKELTNFSAPTATRPTPPAQLQVSDTAPQARRQPFESARRRARLCSREGR